MASPDKKDTVRRTSFSSKENLTGEELMKYYGLHTKEDFNKYCNKVYNKVCGGMQLENVKDFSCFSQSEKRLVLLFK